MLVTKNLFIISRFYDAIPSNMMYYNENYNIFTPVTIKEKASDSIMGVKNNPSLHLKI